MLHKVLDFFLLLSFIIIWVQDERLQELMDAIRGRYKAVLAMLGLPDASSTGPTPTSNTAQPDLQF